MTPSQVCFKAKPMRRRMPFRVEEEREREALLNSKWDGSVVAGTSFAA